MECEPLEGTGGVVRSESEVKNVLRTVMERACVEEERGRDKGADGFGNERER